MNNNLPFRNQFITSGNSITTKPDNQREEFRRFYENMLREQQQQVIIDQGNSSFQNEHLQYNPHVYDQQYNGESDNLNTFQPEVIVDEKVSLVSIHSADRDTNLYPDNNDFIIHLQDSFRNVKKIEMVSSEFTNTDQTIKEIPTELQNNLISWQNQEDKYINFFTNVTIDTIVSNYIDIVVSSGHNQTIGSSVIVNVYNSKLNTDVNITGFIDGKKQVTVIDSETLRFHYVGGIPGQGTANIDLGYPVYTISLKPGNYTASTLTAQIQSTLNLVKRLNGEGIYHYFVVSVNNDTDIITIDSVKLTQLPNNSLSTTSQSFTITVNQKGHGLKTGDRVKMVGVKNLAGIDASILNGDFNVTVLDFNTFTYDVNTAANDTTEGGGNTMKVGVDAQFRLLFDTENTRLQFNTGFPDEDSSEAINTTNPITTKTLSISNAEVISSGQQIRFTTTVDHGLEVCNVINISNIGTGVNPVITTSTPHFLDVPQKVRIRNTNCRPQLDNFYTIIPIGPYDIIVNGQTITSSGNTGQILYSGDQVVIYNIQSIPSINSTIFFVENIPASNQFDVSFHIEQILPDSIPSAIVGTTQLFIHHPSHNFNWLSSIIGSGNFATCKTFLANNYLGFRVDNVSAIDGPATTNTIDILLGSHGLSTSDSIKITNSTTDPSINGTYRVQVVDSDTLRINFVHATFTPGNVTVFTGDQLTISYSKSLPRIDGTYYINNKNIISNISLGTLQTTVTTLYTQNWSVGDTIVITSTDSTPPIDGTYSIVSVIDSSNFTIDLTFNVVSTGSYGVIKNNSTFEIETGFSLLSNYTLGDQNNPAAIIGRSMEVTHYRITPSASSDNNIGGIPLTVLNQTPKTVARLIDVDNYMVRMNNTFASKTVTDGGSNVKVTSEIHGLRSIQVNTDTGDSTGKLYRSITLEGYNFVFLRSPGIKDIGTVLNSANIKDVFAKILLTESPGTVMFNSFLSVPKVFDTPLSSLDFMRFQVVGPNGYLFNFNNINYSFTIAITEIITKLVDTNINPRTGNYDNIPISQMKPQSSRRLGNVSSSDSNKSGALTSAYGNNQYLRSDVGRGYNYIG